LQITAVMKPSHQFDFWLQAVCVSFPWGTMLSYPGAF
jgi:hypothetical protein